MNFEFIKAVDAEFFQRTKAAWLEQILANQDSANATHYDARLAHLEKTVTGDMLTSDGGGCVCAVVENGNDYASALVVISHAKDHFLKMMDITVQPTLDLAETEPNIHELAWIAATAITGSLTLTYTEYPSRELRIYTTFPLDSDFLASVATALFRNEIPHFGVTKRGNWLVVSKK